MAAVRKERTLKVRVDPDRCQGHTLCAMIAPEMFRLSEVDGCASAVSELVPADQQEQVREAAQSCPEQAIFTEDTAVRSVRATPDQEPSETTL